MKCAVYKKRVSGMCCVANELLWQLQHLVVKNSDQQLQPVEPGRGI